MTTDNPDPLEVERLASMTMPERQIHVPIREYLERLLAGTYRRMPDMSGDQRKRLQEHELCAVQAGVEEVLQAAAAIIAQHYAPVIAENERLRQLLPFTRHNINCPVSYGTTADQCLCGLTKARATLAKLEKARTIGSTRTPSRNDVLEEAAIKEAIKDGLDGWIGITDIPEATDSIIAAIRARKDQTDG